MDRPLAVRSSHAGRSKRKRAAHDDMKHDLLNQSIEAGSLVIAAAGHIFLLAGIVRKNITRIGRLPERACVFAFSAWRGYVMIGIMMPAGISLRNSSIPLYYLSLPYSAMGGILLAGSVMFYREFLSVAFAKK